MIISALLFAVMGALVKYATQAGASAPEVTLARFSFGLATMVTLWATGVARISSERPLLVACRGIFGSIAILLLFYSIAYTSMSTSSLLGYMWVVYAPVLSAVVLRERLGPVVIGLLVLSFGGIWLISDPGNLGHFGIGEVCGVLAALFSAIAIVIVRELRRTDSAFTIFFSLSLIGSIVATTMVLLQPNPNPHHPWLLLLGVGISSTLAQLTMTYAYGWCSTAEGSILSMLSPAGGAALGWLLFNDPISWRTILGGALVLGSGVYLTLKPTGTQEHESSSALDIAAGR